MNTKKTERALNAYGCESKGGSCVNADGKYIDANGKVVDKKDAAKDTSKISLNFNYSGDGAETKLNGNNINISFQKNAGQGLIGNEGSNAADAQDFIATGKSVSKYQTEFDSAFVQAVIGEFIAKEDKNWINYKLTITPVKGQSRQIEVWAKSWEAVDQTTVRTNRQNNLNTMLKEDKTYLLTPTNAAGKAPAFKIVRRKN